jgi:hypothetical protein
MQIFIFVGKGGLCGVTKEPSGINLPRVTGPWHFLKKTKLSQERGINPMIALREIKTKGYYLITSENLSGSFGSA